MAAKLKFVCCRYAFFGSGASLHNALSSGRCARRQISFNACNQLWDADRLDEKWMSLNLQARSSLTFRHEAVTKTTGVRCKVGSDSIYLELSQLKSTLREGVLKILSSIRSDLLVGRRRLF